MRRASEREDDVVDLQSGTQVIEASVTQQDVERQTTSFTCQNCGATTSFVATRSIRCPFCGTEYVLAHEATREAPNPEAIIPFDVEEARVQEIYRNWLGDGFFRPRDIREKAADHKMRAVFLPIWECRAEAHSSWTALAGYTRHRTEQYTETENGQTVTKTRQVPYTEWRPASGEHFGSYTRELISASKGLPQDWIQKLGDFEWSKIQDYDPRFLIGRESEESMYDRETALDQAERIVREKEREACRRMVPGDTERNLAVSTRLTDLEGRLVFLPVWLASFTYNGKLYRCVVNGQTGKIGGEAPLDKLKVGGIVAGVVFVVAVITLLIWLLG